MQGTRVRSHPVTSGSSEIIRKPDFLEAEIQYTTSQAAETVTLIHNVLQHMPNSPSYDKHREALIQLLQRAMDFKKPGLCHDKITSFSRSWTDVMVKYLQAKSSPEHDIILKLLEDYGLRNMMKEANTFLFQVVSGKISAPVEEGTPEFAKFLEKRC